MGRSLPVSSSTFSSGGAIAELYTTVAMSTQREASLSTDKELLQATSDSLQMHEQLCHLMKEKLKTNPQAKQGMH